MINLSATAFSNMPSGTAAGFTLDDLADVEEVARKIAYVPERTAEILVTAELNPKISSKVDEFFRTVSVGLSWRGQLKSGQVVRTGPRVTYSDAVFKEEGGRMQEDGIKAYVAANFPVPGDKLRVWWRSPSFLPDPYNGEVYVSPTVPYHLLPNYPLRTLHDMVIGRSPLNASPTTILDVPWEILPKGRVPEKEYAGAISHGAARAPAERSESEQFDYPSRNPDATFIGIRGNEGYVAHMFGFWTIFDNFMTGNAAFVVPSNMWRSLSRLPRLKLAGMKGVERVIHDKEGKWHGVIENYISQRR